MRFVDTSTCDKNIRYSWQKYQISDRYRISEKTFVWASKYIYGHKNWNIPYSDDLESIIWPHFRSFVLSIEKSEFKEFIYKFCVCFLWYLNTFFRKAHKTLSESSQDQENLQSGNLRLFGSDTTLRKCFVSFLEKSPPKP